jgi:hypothetical protein
VGNNSAMDVVAMPQELYEQIRPLILFHETAGKRAKEIDVPQRTLSRKADEFECCLNLELSQTTGWSLMVSFP